jgi:hypothetical protein
MMHITLGVVRRTDHWSHSCIDSGLGKCRMPVMSQWRQFTTNMADPEEGPLSQDKWQAVVQAR